MLTRSMPLCAVCCPAMQAAMSRRIMFAGRARQIWPVHFASIPAGGGGGAEDGGCPGEAQPRGAAEEVHRAGGQPAQVRPRGLTGLVGAR